MKKTLIKFLERLAILVFVFTFVGLVGNVCAEGESYDEGRTEFESDTAQGEPAVNPGEGQVYKDQVDLYDPSVAAIEEKTYKFEPKYYPMEPIKNEAPPMPKYEVEPIETTTESNPNAATILIETYTVGKPNDAVAPLSAQWSSPYDSDADVKRDSGNRDLLENTGNADSVGEYDHLRAVDPEAVPPDVAMDYVAGNLGTTRDELVSQSLGNALSVEAGKMDPSGALKSDFENINAESRSKDDTIAAFDNARRNAGIDIPQDHEGNK